MTDTTKLPPRPALPSHPWPRDYQWTESELRAIDKYGAECRRMALEEAARFIERTYGINAAAIRALMGKA